MCPHRDHCTQAIKPTAQRLLGHQVENTERRDLIFKLLEPVSSSKSIKRSKRPTIPPSTHGGRCRTARVCRPWHRPLRPQTPLARYFQVAIESKRSAAIHLQIQTTATHVSNVPPHQIPPSTAIPENRRHHSNTERAVHPEKPPILSLPAAPALYCLLAVVLQRLVRLGGKKKPRNPPASAWHRRPPHLSPESGALQVRFARRLHAI